MTRLRQRILGKAKRMAHTDSVVRAAEGAVSKARETHAVRRQAKFDRQLFREGDLVFDIGAHRGDRTASFLALGARVVAVEPQPVLAQHLRDRFGPDVIVEQTALGSAEGQAEMAICSAATTVSTLNPTAWRRGRFRSLDFDAVELVAVQTLEGLIARHGTPTYCKVDVEGFEHEVLRGLTTPVRAISFEWAIEVLAIAERCTELLLALDGRTEFNLVVGTESAFALQRWGSAGAVVAYAQSLGPGAWGDIYGRVSD